MLISLSQSCVQKWQEYVLVSVGHCFLFFVYFFLNSFQEQLRSSEGKGGALKSSTLNFFEEVSY